MNILYLIIFFSCLGYVELRKRDFFSPAFIIILLYSLLLFINSFGFSRYQTPWSPTTVTLFFGAFGLFLTAILIVKLHFRVNNAQFIGFNGIKNNVAEEAKLLDWKWFSKWIYVTGIIFMIGFIEAYSRARQIPLFAIDPNNARLDFILKSRIFVHAWLFGPPTLMLSFEYILLSNLSLKKKIPIIIFALIVALSYLMLVSRVDFFRFLIFALLLYHYSKKRISIKTLSVFGISAMVLFLGIYLIRTRNPVTLVLQSQDIKAHFPHGFEWFSIVYTYIVNNFWNFDYAIRRYYEGVGYYPYEYGYEAFKPILQLLFIDAPLSKSYGFDTLFNESIAMVKGLNTVIFLWPLFKDFGPFSLYGLSFIYGIILSFFYYNTMMRKPSLARIGIWAIIAGMLLFSVIVNFCTVWFPFMNMILIWLAHKKKKRELMSSPFYKSMPVKEFLL